MDHDRKHTVSTTAPSTSTAIVLSPAAAAAAAGTPPQIIQLGFCSPLSGKGEGDGKLEWVRR